MLDDVEVNNDLYNDLYSIPTQDINNDLYRPIQNNNIYFYWHRPPIHSLPTKESNNDLHSPILQDNKIDLHKPILQDNNTNLHKPILQDNNTNLHKPIQDLYNPSKIDDMKKSPYNLPNQYINKDFYKSAQDINKDFYRPVQNNKNEFYKPNQNIKILFKVLDNNQRETTFDEKKYISPKIKNDYFKIYRVHTIVIIR